MADAAPTLPLSAVEIGGRVYLHDAKGSLVPKDLIRPVDLLMDEVVRKIHGYATPLAAEIVRFRQHTFDDVDDFVALLAQEYGTNVGGRKGNITLTSFDGRLKVQVANADQIVFGPELQQAKALVDECLRAWSKDSGPEIQAIVERAFNVDQEGKVPRGEMLSLLRLEIADERWQRAMQAVRDSIRVTGTKRYVRFYERDQPDGEWRAIALDMAAGG